MKFEDNRSTEDAKAIYNQRLEDAIEIYEKHNLSFYDRPCPYCGSKESKEAKPFLEKYKVAHCDTCNSLYVNPCPNVDALSDYYNNGKCNIMLEDIVKKRQSRPSVSFILDNRIEAIKRIITSNNSLERFRILEIGCASGIFLKKLKENLLSTFPSINFEFFGIDIDQNAISNPAGNDLNLTCSSVEEFVSSSNQKFDLILHFELIEHLSDPFSFMVEVKKLLVKGGSMLFTTPNMEGLEMVASDYDQYRLLAHGIFPPMHLNAFSTLNITNFLIRAGFKVREISTPGKFDVDMVKICSEFDEDPLWKSLAKLDDKTLGFLQALVIRLKASSHMQCIVSV
ncbi:class I SAM-dependent methyltransferase [Peijinzhouia sedimentorum]